MHIMHTHIMHTHIMHTHTMTLTIHTHTIPLPTLHTRAGSLAGELQQAPGSFFLVRNLTGTRIRFWSVDKDGEAGHPGDGSRAGQPMQDHPEQVLPHPGKLKTIEDGDDRSLELQQWQYAGAGGANRPGTEGRRWLYRTPAVGLQVEAGADSGRWEAWKPVKQVGFYICCFLVSNVLSHF